MKKPKTVKAWAFAWTAGVARGIEVDPNRQSIQVMHEATRKDEMFRVGPIVRIEVPAPEGKSK